MFFFSTKAREIRDDLEEIKKLSESITNTLNDNQRLLEIINERERGLKQLEKEKSKGFPWLAKAIAEYHYFLENSLAFYLEHKSHRAVKAADDLKIIARENRELKAKLKESEYIITYYESLFPWLREYVGNDKDEFIKEVSFDNHEMVDEDDPVKRYLTSTEYSTMSSTEKNQLALDRYRTSKKSPYIIGRDYERYIGYQYESQGYKVEYTGISFGLEDLGRDLICSKGNSVEIIQCKCWSEHKTIHEKHINQLYGTTVKYYIDNYKHFSSGKMKSFREIQQSGLIKPVFITSTKLSETAVSFADALGVHIQENVKLTDYPIIKCNIGAKQEYIYHLPFDQQYDKTNIDKPGESYVSTVKEAEQQGFRRAQKWKGSNK